MSKSRPVVIPLPTKLAMFFLINPLEELTSSDIIAKFGTDKTDLTGVRSALQGWVLAGYFVKTKTPGHGCQRYSTYTAGPQILRQIPKEPSAFRESWDQRMARYAS